MKNKLRTLVSIVLPLCGLVLLLTRQTFAQEEMSLLQAIESEMVTAEITGRDVAFVQPMLQLTLFNQSSEPLNIDVPQGLVLDSTDEFYADMIVAKSELISLAAQGSGDAPVVPLYAYSLDFSKSFPPIEIKYTVQSLTADEEQKTILSRISNAGQQAELSGQLAVWMQAGNIENFEELDSQIEEQSLAAYRQDTEAFINPPTNTMLQNFLWSFGITLAVLLPLVALALYVRQQFMGASPYLLGTYPYMIKDKVSAIGATEYIWRAQHVWNKRLAALKFPISIEGVFIELFDEGERNYDLTNEENIIISTEIRDRFNQNPLIEKGYIILEDINGCSLRYIIDNTRQYISLPLIFEVIDQILGALKYIHEDKEGIISRRIVKPNNILIDDEGSVFLADFESLLSQGTNSADEQANARSEYLAPEFDKDKLKDTKQADIYGVGLVMYEMLIGQLPIQVNKTSSRKLIPDYEQKIKDEAIRAVIVKCLQENPNERYENVDQLRQALPPYTHHQTELSEVVQECVKSEEDQSWNLWLNHS